MLVMKIMEKHMCMVLQNLILSQNFTHDVVTLYDCQQL